MLIVLMWTDLLGDFQLIKNHSTGLKHLSINAKSNQYYVNLFGRDLISSYELRIVFSFQVILN